MAQNLPPKIQKPTSYINFQILLIFSVKIEPNLQKNTDFPHFSPKIANLPNIVFPEIHSKYSKRRSSPAIFLVDEGSEVAQRRNGRNF